MTAASQNRIVKINEAEYRRLKEEERNRVLVQDALKLEMHPVEDEPSKNITKSSIKTKRLNQHNSSHRGL